MDFLRARNQELEPLYEKLTKVKNSAKKKKTKEQGSNIIS
jgi:hypothetical protein